MGILRLQFPALPYMAVRKYPLSLTRLPQLRGQEALQDPSELYTSLYNQAERKGLNILHQQLLPVVSVVNVLLYSGYALAQLFDVVELHVDIPDIFPYENVVSQVLFVASFSTFNPFTDGSKIMAVVVKKNGTVGSVSFV